jgi:hypothetical protein
MNTFYRCGRQWYFRYIRDIKSRPAGAVVVGKGGHKCLEVNFKHKLEVKEDLPLPEFMGTWEEQYDRWMDQDIDWSEVPANVFKDRFLGSKGTTLTRSKEGLLPVIHKDYLPEKVPVLIEHKFTLDVEYGKLKIPVTGIIDLLDEGGVVRDYKFTKADKWKDGVKSDQFTIYGMALEAEGKKVKGYSLDNMVHATATPKVGEHRTKRLKSDRERVTMEIIQFKRQLDLLGEEEWRYPMASPMSYTCSKEYCGYWDYCLRSGVKRDG